MKPILKHQAQAPCLFLEAALEAAPPLAAPRQHREGDDALGRERSSLPFEIFYHFEAFADEQHFLGESTVALKIDLVRGSPAIQAIILALS